MLEALRDDPDCYGILRSRAHPGRSLKSISKESALLLLTLREFSALPQYAIRDLGDQCDRVIGQMMLDGILEVEFDGHALTGPAALKVIAPSGEPPSANGVLAALSLEALMYADALDLHDPMQLSLRLYAFNRIPVSPRWQGLLRDDSAVDEHLGLNERTVAHTLHTSWAPISLKGDGWRAWQRSIGTSDRAANSNVYKLYVSPVPSELPTALAAVVDCLTRSRCFQWKFGANAYGLLRADKIVAYFETLVDVREAAGQLYEKLRGCPEHGVPFTAELGAGALLSWGVDPPMEDHSVPWLQRESWRTRICNRIAVALITAKAMNADVSAPRFALERLALEGIDTTTWTKAS